MTRLYDKGINNAREIRRAGGLTACALAAAPAGKAFIDRENVLQKSYDLERTGRGGRLHARVRRQPMGGNRSGGAEDRRCWLARPGRPYDIRQKRKQVAPLLGTCGAHTQYALDKPAAQCTLRAETTLAPHHGRSQRPLSQIVGWLHPLYPTKRPQRLPVRQQIAAEGLELIPPTALPGLQPLVQCQSHRNERLL